MVNTSPLLSSLITKTKKKDIEAKTIESMGSSESKYKYRHIFKIKAIKFFFDIYTMQKREDLEDFMKKYEICFSIWSNSKTVGVEHEISKNGIMHIKYLFNDKNNKDSIRDITVKEIESKKTQGKWGTYEERI
jgi:hypothetical protein